MRKERFDWHARNSAREFERMQREFGFWETSHGSRRYWCKLMRLQRNLIPPPHRECLTETVQEYGEFSMNDIIHVLTTLGDMANMMYPTSGYVFTILQAGGKNFLQRIHDTMKGID
jgi:hypothetical protein